MGVTQVKDKQENLPISWLRWKQPNLKSTQFPTAKEITIFASVAIEATGDAVNDTYCRF
jgi:hypothetical protein